MVTQFVLQPGAPFQWRVDNRFDAILVSLSDLTLVNQHKSLGRDLQLRKNQVIFLSGAQNYIWKNDDKEAATFLLIQFDKTHSSRK